MRGIRSPTPSRWFPSRAQCKKQTVAKKRKRETARRTAPLLFLTVLRLTSIHRGIWRGWVSPRSPHGSKAALGSSPWQFRPVDPIGLLGASHASPVKLFWDNRMHLFTFERVTCVRAWPRKIDVLSWQVSYSYVKDNLTRGFFIYALVRY